MILDAALLHGTAAAAARLVGAPRAPASHRPEELPGAFEASSG
ncbi:hypothetical protein ACFXGI_02720 [Streptomyces sp. NPDC059355]